MKINWNVSMEDFKLIVAIAKRASKEVPNHPDDHMTIIMDIESCHLNGCPLRLADLLAAEPGDFIHDVLGIRGHIDRKTGKLGGCFLPRYAATSRQVAKAIIEEMQEDEQEEIDERNHIIQSGRGELIS